MGYNPSLTAGLRVYFHFLAVLLAPKYAKPCEISREFGLVAVQVIHDRMSSDWQWQMKT